VKRNKCKINRANKLFDKFTGSNSRTNLIKLFLLINMALYVSNTGVKDRHMEA